MKRVMVCWHCFNDNQEILNDYVFECDECKGWLWV